MTVLKIKQSGTFLIRPGYSIQLPYTNYHLFDMIRALFINGMKGFMG